MRNQTVRLFLYSSLAIVALTFAWGFKNIPQQQQLAEKSLKNSLEQELITLSSAVRSSTQALRFKLLDILKAEGNDKPTRAFSDSIFTAASLVEWDQTFWKPLWHSSKSKTGFQITQFREWVKNWPLSNLNSGEVFFVKVGEENGQAHFAVVVPVRKPNGIPMVGIGVFPASQFGLIFSADRTREIQVFDEEGFALALSRPAYLGASLKSNLLVEQILEGGEVSARSEWKNEAGVSMAGVATRMSDSNLSVAVESSVNFGSLWIWQSWLYLMLCALGAIGLNWWVLNSLVQPLLAQISQSDTIIEQLKRARTSDKSVSPVLNTVNMRPTAMNLPELEDYTFMDNVPELPAEKEAPRVSLSKIFGSALRALDSRLKEGNVRVQQTGLDNVQLAGDALQLQTALEEIIKNSIESMSDGSANWLSVTAERRGDQAFLTIEDTGSGIPEENLDKVFDPFFSTRDAEGVSRGLGLNVVRRVLEELGGSVKIKNRTDTSGTTVELEWPVEKTSAPAKEKLTIEPSSSVSSAASLAKSALNDLEAFEIDEDDEFSTLIMQAPLIPTKAAVDRPNIPVRRPLVRTLDNR